MDVLNEENLSKLFKTPVRLVWRDGRYWAYS
jgi:hypothetical protein